MKPTQKPKLKPADVRDVALFFKAVRIRRGHVVKKVSGKQ